MTEGQRSFARFKKFKGVVQASDTIYIRSNTFLVMADRGIYWYAVHTRPRWEKKVASLLQEKNIRHYCPLNKVIKKWSDRNKKVLEPLFKGYVFVQVEEKARWEPLSINGVVNYVHWLGKPARIRDSEIDTIRRFLHEFEDIQITEAGLLPDKEVRIRQGVLMNYKGILLEVLGNKARVRIDSMGLQLSAVFDKNNLEAV